MAKRYLKKKQPGIIQTAPAPQPIRPAAAEVPFDRQLRQFGLMLLGAITIVICVAFIYYPAIHGGWLMDDDYYITKNATLRDPFGLWNIWLAPGSLVEYYPIEVTIQWIEFQFWGTDTLGYHIVNICLHAVNSLLVWHLFRKLGLNLAWLGALFFAIHPAQVESVAWVAEFKNVLSLAPFLVCMSYWIDFDSSRKDSHYLLSLAFFLIGMLCKITAAPFPVLILLYAWWKRGRINRADLIATIPFFLISIGLGILTIVAGIWYTPGHALEVVVPLGDFNTVHGALSRFACAGLSFAFYFAKFFLPGWLLPMYPHWILDPPQSILQFLPWPIILGASYWIWTKRQTWGRHVILGLGFFLLFLLPFIGFHSISFMRFTWVMDHFLYIPFIGFIALVIAGMDGIEKLLPKAHRPERIGIVVAAVALFVYDSYSYAEMYVGQTALWTYTIDHNPQAWPAYNNLGNQLLDAGDLNEAMLRYQQALALNPDYSEAHANLGIILARMGRLSEGIAQCKEALRINPDFPLVTENLAQMEAIQKQYPGH